MNKLQRVSFDEQSTNTDNIYVLKDNLNLIIEKMNECEFHEICDKCGFPEVKGKKLKSDCVYKSDDCEVCPHWCGNCDEAGHPSNSCFIEKRCPNCVAKDNLADCSDTKCANFVGELFTGRMPFELRTHLNVKIKENPNELLRHNVKSIMLIAEAIYKQGVKDGEGYESMSRAISENKCQ